MNSLQGWLVSIDREVNPPEGLNVRDNELNEYCHRVANRAQTIFVEQYRVKGIIIGGPGPTKETFLKEESWITDYKITSFQL